MIDRQKPQEEIQESTVTSASNNFLRSEQAKLFQKLLFSGAALAGGIILGTSIATQNFPGIFMGIVSLTSAIGGAQRV